MPHSFERRERMRQADYFNLSAEHRGKNGHRGSPIMLHPDHRCLNLAPAIRAAAVRHFGEEISWHTYAHHGLSSQICCLNFLMPLAEEPALLSRLVAGALSIAPPEMIALCPGPEGRPWFIDFEWIGKANYLNEAPKTGRRSRGANATSTDAVVRFRHDGREETLLIEWKYTEAYGPPIRPDGNQTRRARYAGLAFAPHGPVRSDRGLTLDSFFYEPFYQLLRQQMLASRCKRRERMGRGASVCFTSRRRRTSL